MRRREEWAYKLVSAGRLIVTDRPGLNNFRFADDPGIGRLFYTAPLIVSYRTSFRGMSFKEISGSAGRAAN